MAGAVGGYAGRRLEAVDRRPPAGVEGTARKGFGMKAGAVVGPGRRGVVWFDGRKWLSSSWAVAVGAEAIVKEVHRWANADCQGVGVGGGEAVAKEAVPEKGVRLDGVSGEYGVTAVDLVD